MKVVFILLRDMDEEHVPMPGKVNSCLHAYRSSELNQWYKQVTHKISTESYLQIITRNLMGIWISKTNSMHGGIEKFNKIRWKVVITYVVDVYCSLCMTNMRSFNVMTTNILWIIDLCQPIEQQLVITVCKYTCTTSYCSFRVKGPNFDQIWKVANE